MSLHDTLAGLRVELDGYQRQGKTDRAALVEAEIARVEELVDAATIEPDTVADAVAALDAERTAAYITALTEERAGYLAVGRADRVAAVDAELARYAVHADDEPGDELETADGTPPKRRGRK